MDLIHGVVDQFSKMAHFILCSNLADFMKLATLFF